MVISHAGGLDNLLQKPTPDAPTAKARVNINRVLDRILVGRPCPEGAETGKSHQLTVISLRANHRKVPLRFRLEPGLYHIRSARLVVVKSGRIDDRIVEYREYLRRVSLRLALNDGHGRIKDGTQRPASEAENLSRVIAGPEGLVSTVHLCVSGSLNRVAKMNDSNHVALRYVASRSRCRSGQG